MKCSLTCIIMSLVLATPLKNLQAQNNKNVQWKAIKVLVYTKNGNGFVHDNIANAVECIKKLSLQYGFIADINDTGDVFTEKNLKQYQLVIFANTNNDVFENEDQRVAFRRYIEAGGGFVGIHSVMGTERNWTWFKQMLGGTFNMHAHFQQYEVDVLDTLHPSMKNVPVTWQREDECYFEKEMYPGIHTLMVQNTKTVVGLNTEETEKIKTALGSFGYLYPAAWWQQFDGGMIWITTLGHDKKDYSDPVFINHIFQGIRFVASAVPKKDYSKAYANNRDDSLATGK